MIHFYIEQMKKAGTPVSDRKRILPPEEYNFAAEKGYLGGPYDHFVNFFTAIRNGGKVAEDAIFGYRAAAPAFYVMTVITRIRQFYGILKKCN